MRVESIKMELDKHLRTIKKLKTGKITNEMFILEKLDKIKNDKKLIKKVIALSKFFLTF